MNKLTIRLMCLLACGCSRSPNYVPPDVQVPCEWQGVLAKEMQTTSIDSWCWWKSLNDPMLNSLIERATTRNYDLYIAETNLFEARAMLKGANFSLYPHIDGLMNYDHAHYNQKSINRFLGTCCEDSGSKWQDVNFFEAGFDATWEIDLFGKNAHDINAMMANSESSQAQYCDVWISLVAEVARNYIELRGLQQNLAVIDNDVESQITSLQLTHELTQAGFASTIDQKQAEEQLHMLISQRPVIELSIFKSINRLSVLLGYNPGELSAELSCSGALPSIPCEIPVGIPSELLRRRPDIRKAERDLAAATEQVGSAIAALFPRISLVGFIGNIGALCSGNYAWMAGPEVLFPIFNSKLLEQDVKINRIKVRRAWYVYQKTVIGALEEAENAIASLRTERERNGNFEHALASSQAAYNLTNDLYQRGLKSYLDVLTADKSLLAVKREYLESRMALLYHYIALYKVLGGGWDLTCDGG